MLSSGVPERLRYFRDQADRGSIEAGLFPPNENLSWTPEVQSSAVNVVRGIFSVLGQLGHRFVGRLGQLLALGLRLGVQNGRVSK